MATLSHRIGQLGTERRCPLALLHILAKAVMRDSVIALDLDIAIQGQYLLDPSGGPPVVGIQMPTPLYLLCIYQTHFWLWVLAPPSGNG